MQVFAVGSQTTINNKNFKQRYKLSNKTIKHIENKTGLTYKEMTTLSHDETKKLMKERGKLKQPNKIKQWCMSKYKQIGEKLGLLEKNYNIYTNV